MWLCAAAGTAWLLQFIEDMQQSRAFHETCELKLPNEAATIPEVLQFLSPLFIVTLPAQLSIQPASNKTKSFGTLHTQNQSSP
jgi:hypothetical protein